MKVDKAEFDTALAKLIATPATAKAGIKPTTARKKSGGRRTRVAPVLPARA